MQPSAGREEEIRIGFSVFHLIARCDRDFVAVDIDLVEKWSRDLAAPARCDRPWDAGLGRIGEKLACARQGLNILRGAIEGGGMEAAQPFDPIDIDMGIRSRATACC
jgi:hypothetical protein